MSNRADYLKAWHKAHPGYTSDWKRRNPDKVREQQRRHHVKHGAAIYARHRAWYQANKVAIKLARTLGIKLSEARELLCPKTAQPTPIATTTNTKPTTSTFGLAVKTGPKSSNEPKPTA